MLFYAFSFIHSWIRHIVVNIFIPFVDHEFDIIMIANRSEKTCRFYSHAGIIDVHYNNILKAF